VTETWLSRPDAPGDGVSFHQVFSIVQPHSPNLKTPIPMDEVAVLVGAITNLIFELGKVDSMAGGMTIQCVHLIYVSMARFIKIHYFTRKNLGREPAPSL